MRKRNFTNDTWLIIGIFLASRIILYFSGVQLDFTALYRYWQYLDAETLKNNLLQGVWFDHSQPPVFNLFLGIVLKLSGSHPAIVFTIIFKLITLINTFLLFHILKRTIQHPWIPLIFSLVYLLSPASMLFENELFYTSFISLLLLTSCYFLVYLQQHISWKNTAGFFIPLLLACLTRSMYHIFWLLFIAALVLICYRKRAGLGKIASVAFICLALAGSWYVKNYIIFDTFSTSSWMGMNVARNVFHDAGTIDSGRIESIEPFSTISKYKDFLPDGYPKKFTGLNDRDLLTEFKNDSFPNEKNIGYLEVSKQYMTASKQEIKAHPVAYLKNIVQSSIIFFAPATRYPIMEPQAAKIKYYDVLYSFNLSHFAKGKNQRRIALFASAIPKMTAYLFVFFMLLRQLIRRKNIPVLYLFIMSTIAYLFLVSSLFEHYENMRFRYEAEPLFLILAAYALTGFLQARRGRKMNPS